MSGKRGVAGGDVDKVAAEIRYRVVRERANRRVLQSSAGHFDTGPNPDHAEGGEQTLRDLAGYFGIAVPDPLETERRAARLLRKEIGERASNRTEAGLRHDREILDHVASVERGEVV